MILTKTAQPIEPFLKNVLSSLDLQFQSPTQQFNNVEAYATQFGKQLKEQSAIVVNGKPVVAANSTSRLEFQKQWLMCPLSNHQLGSFDCHIIPGANVIMINASGKVRFDESGRSRLGESADLINLNPAGAPAYRGRPLWGSFFGFNMNLNVEQSVINNLDLECINTFNYRLTYKPEDSIIQI